MGQMSQSSLAVTPPIAAEGSGSDRRTTVQARPRPAASHTARANGLRTL